LALGAPVGAAATSGPARGRRKRPRKAGAGVAGVGGHTIKEAGKLITQTSNEVEKGNEERGAVGVGAGVGKTDPRVVGARQTGGASDRETRRQHRCQEKKAPFTGEEDTGATPKLRDAGAVRRARGRSGTGHEQASVAVKTTTGRRATVVLSGPWDWPKNSCRGSKWSSIGSTIAATLINSWILGPYVKFLDASTKALVLQACFVHVSRHAYDKENQTKRVSPRDVESTAARC